MLAGLRGTLVHIVLTVVPRVTSWTLCRGERPTQPRGPQTCLDTPVHIQRVLAHQDTQANTRPQHTQPDTRNHCRVHSSPRKHHQRYQTKTDRTEIDPTFTLGGGWSPSAPLPLPHTRSPPCSPGRCPRAGRAEPCRGPPPARSGCQCDPLDIRRNRSRPCPRTVRLPDTDAPTAPLDRGGSGVGHRDSYAGLPLPVPITVTTLLASSPGWHLHKLSCHTPP